MDTRAPASRPSRLFVVLTLVLAATVVASVVVVAQARREFDVSGHRYSFTVSGIDRPEIHVRQNDLVRIRFSTEDIPHSFTIEDAPYRIMRRAEPGKPVTFDFRADEPGRFPFYCNLTIDDGCREMRGVLIVDPAR